MKMYTNASIYCIYVHVVITSSIYVIYDKPSHQCTCGIHIYRYIHVQSYLDYPDSACWADALSLVSVKPKLSG